MVITYYGASCFKVQSGDTILVFDPPSKKSGFKAPRFQADIVLVSHDHDNHNGADNITAKNKPPFVASGPGEYEIGGVVMRGLRSFHDADSGKKHGLNTIYVVQLEDITLCHMGDFGEKEISESVQDYLGDIDVLFMPADGEEGLLDPENAVKIVNQIEPKIVVPMHYITKNVVDKKKLSRFLEELGQEKTAPVDKLTFKKKDIAEKQTEVVVLKPLL